LLYTDKKAAVLGWGSIYLKITGRFFTNMLWYPYTFFFFHLSILLGKRFSQERTFTKGLLVSNAVVVRNTDPFHTYNIGYENVQNEESLGS